MSFDLLNEVFGDDIEAAEEEKLDIPAKITKIETPLFDIHLKDFGVGNTVVSGSTGMHVESMLNLVDRFISLFATTVIQTKVKVCGEQAVAEDTAPQFAEMFTNEGKLKEEYTENLSTAQQNQAEALYARALAYWKTANSLVEAWVDVLPSSRNQPQLAWNSQTNKAITGFTKVEMREAVKYRMETSPTLRRIKSIVDKRKAVKRTTDSLDINNINEVLGF